MNKNLFLTPAQPIGTCISYDITFELPVGTVFILLNQKNSHFLSGNTGLEPEPEPK